MVPREMEEPEHLAQCWVGSPTRQPNQAVSPSLALGLAATSVKGYLAKQGTPEGWHEA